MSRNLATRNNLPQNHIVNAGSSVTNFDIPIAGNYTGVTRCNLSLDNINVKYGSSSLLCSGTTTGSSSMQFDLTLSPAVSLLDLKKLSLSIFLDDTQFNNITIYGTSNSFSGYLVNVGSYSKAQCNTGWNLLDFSNFTLTNNRYLDTPINKLRIAVYYNNPTVPPNIVFDSLIYNHKTVPSVILTFDDVSKSHINTVKPLLDIYGFKASFMIVKDFIDFNNNFLSTDDLHTLYNAGHDICNHGLSHLDLASVTDIQTLKAEILDIQNWLLSLEFYRSAYLYAYPNGHFNDTVIQYLKDIGIIYARNAKGGTGTSSIVYNASPVQNNYQLNSMIINASSTLNEITSAIEKGLKQGSTTIFYIHAIEDSPSSNNCSTTNLQGLLNYLYSRKVNVLSISEWINSITEPRKVIIRS